MAEELTRSLTMLAERGTARGAGAVLEAARARAAEPSSPVRPTWRRGLVVAIGAAAVVAIVIGIVALLVRPLAGDEVAPVDTAPPVIAPDSASPHPLNQVEAVVLAPDGQLWAATAGGVVRWDLATGEPAVYGDEHGIPASGVLAIDAAPDGTVWAAGDGWIGRYTGTWELFSDRNTPLIDSQIEALAVDDDGVAWVDVASEPPLRFDGTWTQGSPAPAGTWAAGDGAAVAADGTRWAPSAAGISGTNGTGTTTLVVPPAIASRQRGTTTLEPVPGEAPLRIATSIGELEFVTYRIPVGFMWVDAVATAFGPVASEGFNALRWSGDGVTWDGTFPTIAPWRTAVDGDEVIVYGDGYARYAWENGTWTEVTAVALPGPARHLASGPRGVVAVIDDRIYHSADGMEFVLASAGPGPDRLPGAGALSCDHSGPGSYSSPPQPSFGPVIATDTGFVLVTPAHPANWSRSPTCDPLLWFSDDGANWELTSEQSPFGAGSVVHNIAGHDGRWVAVGETPDEDRPGAIWVSDDARTWRRADVELEAAYAVAGGDLGWVVTGTAGTSGTERLPGTQLWFSSDGTAWLGPHQAPDAFASFYFHPELAVGPDAIYAVASTHDLFIVGRLQE